MEDIFFSKKLATTDNHMCNWPVRGEWLPFKHQLDIRVFPSGAAGRITEFDFFVIQMGFFYARRWRLVNLSATSVPRPDQTNPSGTLIWNSTDVFKTDNPFWKVCQIKFITLLNCTLPNKRIISENQGLHFPLFSKQRYSSGSPR